MNTFISVTLIAFVLLIESLRLNFRFFGTNHLFMPLVNKCSVAAFPLWEELFDFFLSEIVVLLVTMKTCLAFKSFNGFFYTFSLFRGIWIHQNLWSILGTLPLILLIGMKDGWRITLLVCSVIFSALQTTKFL